MAPGGTAVRTVRSRVLSGGALPEVWNTAGWTKVLTDTTVSPDAKRVYVAFQNPMYQAGVTVANPAAHGMIPASYGGHRLQRRTLSAGEGRGTIVKQVNELESSAGTGIGLGPNSWLVDFRSGDTSSPYNSGSSTTFALSAAGLRGHYSEEGFHGVVPSINSLDMDSQHGANIREAVGWATRRST